MSGEQHNNTMRPDVSDPAVPTAAGAVPAGDAAATPAAVAAPAAAAGALASATADPANAALPTATPGISIPGIPDDRPELKVAAAFGGSLVLAFLLKRLAR